MKKENRYIYPAVFTYEEGYEIAVTFPDFPGCATSGEDEREALQMARDALGGRLWCMEDDGEAFPEPTAIGGITLEQGECVVMVDVYLPAVRLAQENKAVTKTVTIPAWLNAESMRAGVNFSQVLQTALVSQLGVSRRI